MESGIEFVSELESKSSIDKFKKLDNHVGIGPVNELVEHSRSSRVFDRFASEDGKEPDR